MPFKLCNQGDKLLEEALPDLRIFVTDIDVKSNLLLLFDLVFFCRYSSSALPFFIQILFLGGYQMELLPKTQMQALYKWPSQYGQKPIQNELLQDI